MSLVEKIDQLNQEIGAAFDQAVAAVRREMQEHLRATHQDLQRKVEALAPAPPRAFLAHEDLAAETDGLRAHARHAALGDLQEAIAEIDRARSQSDALAALIAGSARFASRAAVLLVRGGELRGWGGRGFDSADAALSGLALAPPPGGPWSRVAALSAGPVGSNRSPGADPADPADNADGSGAGAMTLSPAECAVLCERIESPLPAGGLLVPMVLRDQVVAVLYADQTARSEPAQALPVSALQSLVYVTALAIETLPFRQRAATATLASAAAAPGMAPGAPAAPETSATPAVPADTAAPAKAGGPAGDSGASGDGAAAGFGAPAGAPAAADHAGASRLAADSGDAGGSGDGAGSAAEIAAAAQPSRFRVRTTEAVAAAAATAAAPAADTADTAAGGSATSGTAATAATADIAAARTSPAPWWQVPPPPAAETAGTAQTSGAAQAGLADAGAGGLHAPEAATTGESPGTPGSVSEPASPGAHGVAAVALAPDLPPATAAAGGSIGGGPLQAPADIARSEEESDASSRYPDTPFAVTPATLYDSPRVAVVQRTAEIPLPPGLSTAAAQPGGASPYLEEPATATSAPDAPAAAAASPAETGESPAPPSPSPSDIAATPAVAAAAAAPASPLAPATPEASPVSAQPVPAAANETVLLPHAALRDAAGTAASAWSTRLAEPAVASGASGPSGSGGAANLRVVPPPPPTPPTPPNTAAGAANLPSPSATAPASWSNAPGAPAPLLWPPAAPAAAGQPSGAPPLQPVSPSGSLGSGTPEVRPPTGVQGPGWAFATGRLPAGSGDEALHEEARRLARLLVSEIKLYNEEQVEAGRRNRDIYERLREDIDRSRQMYEERVEPRLVKSTDYFYQELVRILAAGDSKALGI
jgi:hypothetical protein